jgi:hypothetical protein
MLAISLRQPWPTIILNAGCPVINKGWPTDVRGGVLLHASKTPCSDREWREAIDLLLSAHPFPRSVYIPLPADMPRGGIVGSVEIVDCVSRPPKRSGEWFIGPYGFVLRNMRHLPFRPWRGDIGFWEAPDFLGARYWKTPA